MRKFTKAMLRAAEKTVYAYEKAIIEGVDEDVWRGYGTYYNCHLCKAAAPADADWPVCDKCLLYIPETATACYEGDLEDTYHKMLSGDRSVKTLRSRLKLLLKRMERNGYVFE